jgi:hypothetical protein
MFAGRAIGKADALLTIPGIAIVVVTGLRMLRTQPSSHH